MPNEEVAHEEDEERETFTSWVLDTLGGVKEEIFDSLVNTGGNTSWVDGIVGTLVNEELNEMGEVEDGSREEEEESESCAVVTWRCLSQVFTMIIILTLITVIILIILITRIILFSLRFLKVEFATSADPLVFGGE